MRWFKHLSGARRNSKLRCVEKLLGEAGYSRFFKLLEVIAERGAAGQEFHPRIDLATVHTNPAWLAEELGISPKEFKKTLRVFARAGLIDSNALRKKIVSVPQMLEYRDEWTRRSQSRGNSGDTPEWLRSHSGKKQKADLEGELDAREESAPTSSAVGEAWNALGQSMRLGTPPFQRIWEAAYTNRDTRPLSAVMEMCIQRCQDKRITIPRPFYKLKRRIEEQEGEAAAVEGERSRVPTLEDIVPKEH